MSEDLDPLRERRHPEGRPDRGDAPPEKADYRSPYARDADRILYSSAFRRLNGVTQVVSADETLLFHNRLTHSLKVAQVAKRIAQRLQRDHDSDVDPDCAEAAALAHDLGHPPFGHIAEDTLLELCEEPKTATPDAPNVDINGYEGNAQSFRIVTRLSWRSQHPGLNLTRRTLLGILKYPWLRNGEHAGDNKWGAYESEMSDFRFATGGTVEVPKTLETQIMDWADDITYAVHDLEDFYRAGLTPVSRLHYDDLERSRFIARATGALKRYDEFDETTGAKAFTEVFELIPFERPYEGTNDDRRLVHQTGSNLITRFLDHTALAPAKDRLDISNEIWHEVNMLKQLTWHYVIHSPDLATIQEGQKRVVRNLFQDLTRWAHKEGKRNDRLPTRYRELIKGIKHDAEARGVLDDDADKIHARAAADYIASLTEGQAVELHGRFQGVSRASVLQGWVRT